MSQELRLGTKLNELTEVSRNLGREVVPREAHILPHIPGIRYYSTYSFSLRCCCCYSLARDHPGQHFGAPEIVLEYSPISIQWWFVQWNKEKDK